MATAINPTTGVEYYTDGSLEGQSVALYVAVTDGQVRNPNGVRWPFLFGGEHDQAANYYERVPFSSVPFDAELFVVDNENSGWAVVPKADGAPAGHPQGTYEYSETIKRRSVDELKALVKGYADRYNSQIWTRENGYTEKLQYAKEQIVANNNLVQYTSLIARHEALLQASFHNDARLAQLYSEIEAAGETGAVDFVVNQMATAKFPEGWVNGIEQ